MTLVRSIEMQGMLGESILQLLACKTDINSRRDELGLMWSVHSVGVATVTVKKRRANTISKSQCPDSTGEYKCRLAALILLQLQNDD